MTKESAGEAWGILFKVKKFHKTKIVKVKRVEEGSHAMRCGLCTDDRIIAIDDEQVRPLLLILLLLPPTHLLCLSASLSLGLSCSR